MGKQTRKYTLGIAGEYFVSAELNRRGIHASMTYGNAKKADVVAFSPEKKNCEIIEVKTTDKNKWVIGSKVPEQNDDIWVLVLLKDNISPKYFVFSSKELYEILKPEDIKYRKQYREKHGKEFTGNGVVSLKVEQAKDYENKWDKLVKRFST